MMSRRTIRSHGIGDSDVDELMSLLGPFLPDVELAVSIRDPDDAPVVAAALSSHAEAIITCDRDLLEDDALYAWLAERGVEVVAPVEALRRLGG